MGPPQVPVGIPVRSGAAAATKQAVLSPNDKTTQRMSMPPPRLPASNSSSTSSRPSVDERVKTPLQESPQFGNVANIDAQFEDLLVGY